jgi:hypothetical protein
VPTAAACRAGTPNVWGGRERGPLHGRAPRAALALPAASGPARSRASFPCARASAWNRVALTWARGRGCAAPPQTTTSATPARQLWRPRSRRTRRSRRSNSQVRKRARVAAGDGGVGGRLCPRLRPAAQARPMCGEGGREGLCTAARLGLRSPYQQRRAPRVLVRASLARVLRLWNRVALTWALNRGCTAPPQRTASAPTARQLWRPRSRRTRRSRRSTSDVRERARVAVGDGGGWGTLVPTAAACRAGAPNVWGGRERGPLHGRAPRAALALPAASGPARSRASFPCARASAWNRVALTWARDRGCAAPPQTTASVMPARQLWRPRSRRTRRSRMSTSTVRERARVAAGVGGGWGTLVPTAAACRAGTPNVWGGRETEPLHGRAPRAALALPAASGPARSRASSPCARASAWNRVALTWARGRGCAAPPQTTTSAPTARQLWRSRSRRTRRSRRSASGVRTRALGWPRGMEGLGDAWAHGRGPPRRRAQCAGREREREPLRGRAPRAALALPAASGPARSRASFPCARASAWNRVALTWARGRGCAAPPQGTTSAAT